MKPFAFLIPTPSWAKENDYGQFNGYIAFPASMWDELVENPDGYTNYHLPAKVFGLWVEVTFSAHKLTLDKFGGILPVTAIPEEAATGEPFCVFGYDTCRMFNSWEQNDYDNEAKFTREWLRLAVEMWADELSAM